MKTSNSGACEVPPPLVAFAVSSNARGRPGISISLEEIRGLRLFMGNSPAAADCDMTIHELAVFWLFLVTEEGPLIPQSLQLMLFLSEFVRGKSSLRTTSARKSGVRPRLPGLHEAIPDFETAFWVLQISDRCLGLR